MTAKVIVKSNKYGINLILDEQIPFPELLAAIAEKFEESGSFFKDAKMAVSFDGRPLTQKQEQEIIDTIMNHSAIRIVSIIDSNKELEDAMQQGVEQASGYTVRADVASRDTTLMDTPQLAADFYKGNLRSGQTLECTSSVTLIGDVNPGAKIISDGNIVVLGSMKGNAHAGACGDNNCFIFALDMKPIQLQIGDLIAKSPDKEKENWRTRKKAKADNVQYASQIAMVKDGCICIEPMTKGCLDRL